MGHGADTQRFIGSLQVVGGLADMLFGAGYGGTGGGLYLLGSGAKNLAASPSGTAAAGQRNKGFLTDLGLSLGAQGAAYGLGALGGSGGFGLSSILGGSGSSSTPMQPQPNPIQPSPPQQQPQAQPIAATGPSGGPMPTPALASTPVNSTDPAVLMQQARKNWQLLQLQQALAGSGVPA